MTLFDDWPTDYQEQFWKLYPRRIAKAHAMKALDKIAGIRKNRPRRSPQVPWATITSALARYTLWLEGPGWRPDAKHPATWLNAGCWDDELPILKESNRESASRNGFAAVRRALI
jgi:hypothetical protein